MVFRVSIAGWNLGFTASFWISMTELLNSHDNKNINKNQCVYQWICDIQVIWKLSYINLLWIIVFELSEHWTMLITFLFLALILSIWLTISQIILRKISFSNFLKNMTRLPSLWKGSYKNSPIHLSIFHQHACDAFFSGSIQWSSFIFFAWGYFAIYTKKGQIQILENSICCLDNWVNKTNLDQKQKMWHLTKTTSLFVN